MRTTFYVHKNRIDELKIFIREKLPSARFLQNPYEQGNEYGISLELSVDDGNKLSELRNNWYNQDNLTERHKKSFWKMVLSNFYYA